MRGMPPGDKPRRVGPGRGGMIVPPRARSRPGSAAAFAGSPGWEKTAPPSGRGERIRDPLAISVGRGDGETGGTRRHPEDAKVELHAMESGGGAPLLLPVTRIPWRITDRRSESRTARSPLWLRASRIVKLIPGGRVINY